MVKASSVNEADKIDTREECGYSKHVEPKTRKLTFKGASGARLFGANPLSGSAKDFRAVISVHKFGAITVGQMLHDGNVQIAPPDQFGHNHPVARLVLLQHGSISARVGPRKIKAGAGSGFLLTEAARLKYETRQRVATLFMDVAMDDPQFAFYPREIVPHWIRPEVRTSLVADAINRVVTSNNTSVQYSGKQFLRTTFESYSHLLLRDTPGFADADGAVVAQAIACMKHNHTNPEFTVGDVAKYLGIADRTLRQAFRDTDPPYQHLRRLRAETALSMLNDANTVVLSVSEVAHRAGFGSADQMRRTLRQAAGRMWPGVYTPVDSSCENPPITPAT